MHVTWCHMYVTCTYVPVSCMFLYALQNVPPNMKIKWILSSLYVREEGNREERERGGERWGGKEGGGEIKNRQR